MSNTNVLSYAALSPTEINPQGPASSRLFSNCGLNITECLRRLSPDHNRELPQSYSRIYIAPQAVQLRPLPLDLLAGSQELSSSF